MTTRYHLYLNGMQIGEVADENLRWPGEATALVEALIASFNGKVERGHPFKSQEIECISLFPWQSNDPHRKFLEEVHKNDFK